MEQPQKTALIRRKTGIKSPLSDLLTESSKLPPQALEFEEAVLGALMLEKSAIEGIIDVLKREHFYDTRHAMIFGGIVRLFERSEPVDMITVANALRVTGELELVGGLYYLSRLTSRVNSASNIEYHARIIIENSIKREIIRISGEAQRDAYDPGIDVFQLLDKTEQELFNVGEANIKKNYMDMASVLKQALQELEEKKEMKDGLTGVPSGFSELDRHTSGWQKSDLIILAARPGMGKTAFVVSCARNAAVAFKKPVAIFSLEMSAVQLVNRMISSEAELESEKLRKGQLAEHEWRQLHHKITALVDAPMFIDDTPALSILELRAKCRRLKAQHDIQMIVIDYLQLMTGDQSKGANREQEIASISRSLKNLAKELNVPVIALSQLSRNVEQRTGGKKPQLSDLRESGSLEQDADMVVFLYRPEYYGITQDEEGRDMTGVGEVIIAKHRNGGLETVQLKFVGRYTKFVNMTDTPYVGMGFNSTLPATEGRVPSEFDQPFGTGGGGTITLGSRMNDLPQPLEPDDAPPF